MRKGFLFVATLAVIFGAYVLGVTFILKPTVPDFSSACLRKPTANDYDALILRYSRDIQLNPLLVKAIVSYESSFNHTAKSGDKVGLMGVKLSSANLMGFNGTLEDLIEPDINLRFGCLYLSYAILETGSVERGVEAYGVGVENYKRGVRDRDYVRAIEGHLKCIEDNLSIAYKLQGNETLLDVARRFNVYYKLIMEVNNITSIDELKAGDLIIVPRGYIVKQGDTLYNIGLRYGIPWEKIAEENDISSPYTIMPGQILKIPNLNLYFGAYLVNHFSWRIVNSA